MPLAVLKKGGKEERFVPNKRSVDFPSGLLNFTPHHYLGRTSSGMYVEFIYDKDWFAGNIFEY